MCATSSSLIIGKRRAGKTVLTKDLLYHMRSKLWTGVGMTDFEDYSDIVPASCMRDFLCTDTIDHMMSFQKTNSKAMNRSMFIFMDACIYDSKHLKTESVGQLFLKSRNRKIFSLCAIQYLMDITPMIRAQFDYVFIFKSATVNERIKIWKKFFGMLSFADFCAVLDAVTTPAYNCLVLDNTVRSSNPTDYLFWYNATPDLPSSFRLCESGWDEEVQALQCRL